MSAEKVNLSCVMSLVSGIRASAAKANATISRSTKSIVIKIDFQRKRGPSYTNRLLRRIDDSSSDPMRALEEEVMIKKTTRKLRREANAKINAQALLRKLKMKFYISDEERSLNALRVTPRNPIDPDTEVILPNRTVTRYAYPIKLATTYNDEDIPFRNTGDELVSGVDFEEDSDSDDDSMLEYDEDLDIMQKLQLKSLHNEKLSIKERFMLKRGSNNYHLGCNSRSLFRIDRPNLNKQLDYDQFETGACYFHLVELNYRQVFRLAHFRMDYYFIQLVRSKAIKPNKTYPVYFHRTHDLGCHVSNIKGKTGRLFSPSIFFDLVSSLTIAEFESYSIMTQIYQKVLLLSVSMEQKPTNFPKLISNYFV